MMQRILATPVWADFRTIRSIYEKAARLTEQTGIRHEVDHEIPLNGRYVCGLHVEFNLRVLPASANLAKSNAWCQWHGELFSEPEQLKLWL